MTSEALDIQSEPEGDIAEPILVRLTATQISLHWEAISIGILNGLRVGPIDDMEVVKARLLQAILRRYLECWVIVPITKQRQILGVITTLFSGDMYAGEKTLIIYSLYRYEKMEQHLWPSLLKTLLTYAKANNCHRLIAYTEFDRVVELATSLGAKTSVRLLEWEV